MAETVNMPKLGFDMAEGTLVRWVIPEGEAVKKGGVLAEIETDKATVEVESSHEGTVLRHLVDEGTVVPVGSPIAVVGQPGENVEEEKPTKEEIIQAGEAAAPPEEFTQADLAEGTDKELRQAPGLVGGVASKGQQPTEPLPSPAQPAVEEAEQGGIPGGLRASPLARRMADEKGIDIRRVQGTGPGGRITKKDIENYCEQPAPVQPSPAPVATQAAAAALVTKKPAVAPLPAFSPLEPAPEDQKVPLSRLRAAVGRRMVQSTQQVPHFYVTHDYKMEAAMQMRSQVNDMLPQGEKISVNDFIVKAVALTLRQFPNLNASLEGDQIVHYGHVNVGVAVAVEGGLLTVVCRDTDRKSLRQISSEVRTMADRARLGKVRPDDIEGSTFSVSNLGMFDVEDFVAIINPPEAAILAIGSVRDVPVIENGEIKAGKRMKATISIDHRVSDGAEAARFLQALAPYLEDPLRLLV